MKDMDINKNMNRREALKCMGTLLPLLQQKS